jgi:predicted RNA-binding protein (TIGR00451 family)
MDIFQLNRGNFMLIQNLSKTKITENLKSIFAYQFSSKFSDLFFKVDLDLLQYKFSKKTGKIRYIYYDKELQASYRANLGTFTLTLSTGLRILPQFPSPNLRIVVQNDVSPFIRDGKSVFCKHVVLLDESLLLGDEVFVVNEEDQLLAVGKMDIPATYVQYFNNGTAVNVRKGINSFKPKK